MPREILQVFIVGIFAYLTLGGAATADTEPAPGVLAGGPGVALGPANSSSDLNRSDLPVPKYRTVAKSRLDPAGIGLWADPHGFGSMIAPTGIGFSIDPKGIGLWLDPSGLGSMISSIGFFIDPHG